MDSVQFSPGLQSAVVRYGLLVLDSRITTKGMSICFFFFNHGHLIENGQFRSNDCTLQF